MKFLKIILLLVFCISTLNAKTHKNLNEEFHLAVAIYKYKDSHRKKIKSVVLRLSSAIEQELGIKFNIFYIDNVNDEINSFINYDKSNVIIIYTSTYLENKELLKEHTKNPFFISGDGGTTQYYLVANKKSNIKNLKDIKGKSFITFKGFDSYNMWLDYLTLKELNISYEKVVSSIKNADSTKRLLLDVYFKKYDFTVVTKKVYNDMVLLNPSLKKELIIIRKSKEIFQNGMGLFHIKTPQKIVEKLINLFEKDLFKDKQDDILSIVNRGRIKQLEYKKLEELESFWNEYKKLQTKNK